MRRWFVCSKTTLIRVGNPEYAARTTSFGLDDTARSACRGRGGRIARFSAARAARNVAGDPQLARVVKNFRTCQELPGQELFQYIDEDRELRAVSSGDVNDYLQEIAGSRHHCQGFSHLGRDGAGARFLADGRVSSRSATPTKRSMSAAIRQVAAAGQHAGRLPQVLHPSRR